MVGFVDSGFVRRLPDAAGTTVPVGLGIDGSIASWPTADLALGLLLCGILVARRVRAGLFIGIVITAVVAVVVKAVTHAGPSVVDGEAAPTGWSLAVPAVPDSLGGLPNLSLIGEVDLIGAFTRIGPLVDLGNGDGVLCERSVLPAMKTALVVVGVVAGARGFTSSSSNTVFLVSATGIAEGARTGLANIVTGAFFLVAMFFTPLYEVVPVEAAAPALIVVGALMMSQIVQIDFSRFAVDLPAFLTIVTMPFTYSIANGIGVGFIAWVVLAAATGKARSVHPLLWVVAAAFLVFFGIGPISDALA